MDWLLRWHEHLGDRLPCARWCRLTADRQRVASAHAGETLGLSFASLCARGVGAQVEKCWPERATFYVARVVTVGSCLLETVSAVRCLGISLIARRTAPERHAARSQRFP